MICDQVKYRSVVNEDWGFRKKSPYGRGLCALFYGSPGTGKTMAVQVMANELGLDLYRIDLSQLSSKYIGETQKNIAELFRRAKNINAMLFFDEADSMFAKRSEVKDSNDRYANADTAFLLQKLEDYEGITILATNYVNNIDDAFKRRIKFMINFVFPTADVRLMLWKKILPESARVDEDIDFEFFADNFELPGSNIKEILTNAAFLAASEGAGLRNDHIIEAVKLNYSKYGKILTNDDFGYLSR
ncbi:MAG: ATP-binding protein [Ruminiclostridium sp.]|nr:ATP-binding protein [Ruminiclostridium sp.]